MTASVSSHYSTIFGLSGSLGVGTASLLGGDATNTNPDASTVLAQSQTATTGPLSVLSSANTGSAFDKSTLYALTEGKLTNAQHRVIAALGTADRGTYSIPWDKNTEPTVVAQIRKLGWIKLVKPTFDRASQSVTAGDYQLTTVGKAIFKRTDGKAATDKNSRGPDTLATYNAQNITPAEETVIGALASTKSGSLTIPWNYGQEPGVLSTLRKSGWVQLASPNFDPFINEFGSGTYKLTGLGQKINTVLTASAQSSESGSTTTSVTA